MVHSVISLTILSSVFSFALIFSGRLICSSPEQLKEFVDILTLSAGFSLLSALAVNLALAVGSIIKLQKSAGYCIYYLLIHLILNKLKGALPVFWNAGLFLVLIILLYKNRKYEKKAIFQSAVETFPYYLKKKPFQRAIETIFRLFPHAEPIGLYKTGHPEKGSPLYITGNFSLTVRSVFQKLKNQNCWILICDSKGINIWCSSLSGHFNTNSIISGIKETSLRTGISPGLAFIPQLSAAAVNSEKVSRALGIPVYFDALHSKGEILLTEELYPAEQRMVSFPLINRLEMALGAPFFSILLSCLIYNFFAPLRLLYLIPLLYGGSIIQSFLQMSKNLWLKMLLCSSLHLCLLLLIQKYKSVFSPFDIAFQTILIAYLVFEFEGWSPLVKFGIGMNYKKISLQLDTERCTGCGSCLSVCPKNVFTLSLGKSIITNGQECIQCRSCTFQCPVDALQLNSS